MFGKFRDFFWPLGATVLALFVAPIAIEQYPEVFKESPWILPMGICIVCICWLIPLAVHDRSQRFKLWTLNKFGKRVGWMVVAASVSVLLAGVFAAGSRLYATHKGHLEARLNRDARERTKTTQTYLAQPDSYAADTVQLKAERATKNESRIVPVAVSADMVCRIHMRGRIPKRPTTQDLEPVFKELFYEWQLAFAPTTDMKEVVITIRDEVRHDTDRIRVVPTSGIVSEAIPHWMSGFAEPGKEPDFYTKTVTFAALDKGQSVSITIRRPMKFESSSVTFPPIEFARSVELTAAGTRFQKSKYSAVEDIPRLFRHLETIANWHNGDRVIPIKIDPDAADKPLASDEFESTVEGRCQEDECKHLQIRNLEVRRGRT